MSTTNDIARDVAERTRTCEACGGDFLPDTDPPEDCPDWNPGPDSPTGPHIASTKRRLTVTSLVNIEMLDQLGPQYPVGIGEIARALGVRRQTADVWKWPGNRNNFPAPQPTTLGSRPFWLWGDVRDWAVRTGRITEQPVDVQADTDDGDDGSPPPVTKIGAVRHPRTPQRSDDEHPVDVAEPGPT